MQCYFSNFLKYYKGSGWVSTPMNEPRRQGAAPYPTPRGQRGADPSHFHPHRARGAVLPLRSR